MNPDARTLWQAPSWALAILLACLGMLGPFSIDTYLPAFTGIAQALYEGVSYDDDGNPLTGNLMDYAMPSAAEFPTFEAVDTETPTPLNPLGAKGIGESGTIGSTPAVQNAVIDALSHLGVRHIDMPLSAHRVWQAIGAARA